MNQVHHGFCAASCYRRLVGSVPSTSEVSRPAALRRALARAVEWLLRRNALRAAYAVAASDTASRRTYRHYARVALELAERSRELRSPGTPPAALPARSELYRESAYWALLTLQPPSGSPPSYAELWARTTPERLAAIAGSAEAAERLRELAVNSSFFDLAAPSPEEQDRRAHALAALAHGLEPLVEDPVARVEALQQQRLWRIAVPVIGVLTVAFMLLPRLKEWNAQRNDLAFGKPWRASSEWIKCQPEERRCGNFLDKGIFFHTNEEASPWVEFDLGKEARFSEVEVINRSDCCAERAVPLIVEVSSNRKTFRSVARRDAGFDRWLAEFPPVQARYVRLRVDGNSVLHLERVRVLP